MDNRIFFLLLVFFTVSFHESHEHQAQDKSNDEDPNGKIHFTSKDDNGGKAETKGVKHAPIHDAKHVHDKEHIKEHLQEFTNVKEDDLSDANLQFHYFKLHDYDNNDRLDGIELSNAMTHYHDEETGEKAEDYSEDELGSMVDQILEEDDTNHDGYIDYPEFIASQTRE